MTDSDRHAKIKAAFLQVLAKPEDERAAALDQLCAGDDEMRRELETLLRYSTGADQTISIATEKPPRLRSGDVYASRYRVISLLGRGSIGEVYRAEDTTLGVEVALKILINPSSRGFGSWVFSSSRARSLADSIKLFDPLCSQAPRLRRSMIVA